MIYVSYAKTSIGQNTMRGIKMNEVVTLENSNQLVVFMADLAHKVVTTYENNHWVASDFTVLFADFADNAAIWPEHVPPFGNDKDEFYAFYTSSLMPADIVDKFATLYLRNRHKRAKLDCVKNADNQQIYFYKVLDN